MDQILGKARRGLVLTRTFGFGSVFAAGDQMVYLGLRQELTAFAPTRL